MAAAKIPKAANLSGRLHRTGHDSFQRGSDLRGQGLDHRMSSLAQRHDEYVRIRVQVIKILADAQNSPLAMHVPRKTFNNRGLSEHVLENFAHGITHAAKLEFAIGVTHGENYKDRFQLSAVRSQRKAADALPPAFTPGSS